MKVSRRGSFVKLQTVVSDARAELAKYDFCLALVELGGAVPSCDTLKTSEIPVDFAALMYFCSMQDCLRSLVPVLLARFRDVPSPEAYWMLWMARSQNCRGDRGVKRHVTFTLGVYAFDPKPI